MELVKEFIESVEIEKTKLDESEETINRQILDRWNESFFYKTDNFSAEKMPEFIDNIKKLLLLEGINDIDTAVKMMSDYLTSFINQSKKEREHYYKSFGAHMYYIAVAKSPQNNKIFALFGIYTLDVKFAPRRTVVTKKPKFDVPCLREYFLEDVIEKVEWTEEEMTDLLSVYRIHKVLKEFQKQNLIDRIKYV